jgi:hypothetical protein
LLLASSYQVRAKSGVSIADLNKQLTVLAALPGVTGAYLAGPHLLRVDLNLAQSPAQRTLLLDKLNALGTVSVSP